MILENVFVLSYLLFVSLAYRLTSQGFQIPYTACCFPFLLVLIQRFLWYRAFFRSFRTPFYFVKFLFQLLVGNLVLNMSIRADEYFNFDVIGLLWPCYGFIAMTFIFFIGGLLLFIGSACNNIGYEEE